MALKPKPQRSLKARALQWLAQREQSRTELRRKLMPYARAEFSVQPASDGEGEGNQAYFVSVSPAPPRATPEPTPELTPEARVEAVLDWLETHRYLSQARFVESRINARAPRFGNLRICHELKQHQAVLSADAAQLLKDSELQRASAVRSRKFRESPENPTERARQGRFLLGRGFSHDVVRRVMRETGRSARADTDTDSNTAEADRNGRGADAEFEADAAD